MFLPWLNVVARSTLELLWYLKESPPPPRTSTVTRDESVPVNVQPVAGVSLAESTAKTFKLSPAVAVVRSPSPSLFALIIGINKYKDPAVSDLRGAVPDANAVQDFLITKLRVAKGRIVNLRNEEATREAMVNAFQDLAHNQAIGKEDPIFIYYAGHGSEARPPASWITNNANGLIQMLCPHDFDSKGSKDHRGQGLFDLTLSELLTCIAESKSNNITVIFDSCHSGSGTRLPDESSAARCIELPPNYSIPENVYGFESRGSAVPSGEEKSGLNSHVLLAACKKGQTASESETHGTFTGAFTTAFLSFLEANLNSIDRLTYTDIVTRMPVLSNQNPQCEGVNSSLVIFNSKVAAPFRNLYKIYAPKSPGQEYTLEAGEAHGITKGAEFDIFSDDKMIPGSRIGSVVARHTNPFTTQCSPVDGGTPFLLSQPAFAVQTRVGEGQDLRLFIEPNDAFLHLFVELSKEMQRTDLNRRSFYLLDNDSDKPDLALSTRDGLVGFYIKDDICIKHGLTRMPFDDVRVGDTDYLISILRSAADFYWNFHHSSKDVRLTSFITVECFKLVPSGELNDTFREVLIPDPNGENLVNNDDTIIIDVDERAKYGNRYQPVKYGFKITNNSKASLYAALFYFDISDLSIKRHYQPGTAANGQADFSLPANGSLTIGYGDSGEAPQNYRLRANQIVDVGFLKVYISGDFVDYTSIAQDSPFGRNRAISRGEGRRRCLWGALTIPIIQRKGTVRF